MADSARLCSSASAAMRGVAQCATRLPAAPRCARRRGARRAAAAAAAAQQQAQQVTGLVFRPFDAVAGELAAVEAAPASSSLARLDYHPDCEAAVNEQINIEYNVSYVYHSLYAYFARDNVGLPGIAAYFKRESAEERHHAELLMEFQLTRGGRVRLGGLAPPEAEFGHAAKGDALHAFELQLSLEKLNFARLRALHAVADACGDSQMADFVEGELLGEQADAVRGAAERVAQLRRVGQGLGVYEFDRQLAAQLAA